MKNKEIIERLEGISSAFHDQPGVTSADESPYHTIRAAINKLSETEDYEWNLKDAEEVPDGGEPRKLVLNDDENTLFEIFFSRVVFLDNKILFMDRNDLVKITMYEDLPLTKTIPEETRFKLKEISEKEMDQE